MLSRCPDGGLAGGDDRRPQQIDLPPGDNAPCHPALAPGGALPACRARRSVAAVPEAAKGTPFGRRRFHAMATYLKTFQALSYERLQSAFADLFGLTLSQGGLMTMLRRAQGAFVAERDGRFRRCAGPDRGRLRRDRRSDRGLQRLSLGVSLRRGGGPSRLSDPSA